MTDSEIIIDILKRCKTPKIAKCKRVKRNLK
jgi:hypothetical protein